MHKSEINTLRSFRRDYPPYWTALACAGERKYIGIMEKHLQTGADINEVFVEDLYSTDIFSDSFVYDWIWMHAKNLSSENLHIWKKLRLQNIFV